MHITIFEEKDFNLWCQNDIENHKESIKSIVQARLIIDSLWFSISF